VQIGVPPDPIAKRPPEAASRLKALRDRHDDARAASTAAMERLSNSLAALRDIDVRTV
jgi:hypothetical protein